MIANLFRISLRLLLMGLALAGQSVQAQGILVDRRPSIPLQGSYRVQAVEVDAQVRDQVAQVRVTQVFHNPGSADLEAQYLFPLPDDGAVHDFVLMVDGQELPGRLLAQDEARAIYESIVREKKDPALMEYAGRGLLKTSVFPIPAGQSRTVTMQYDQLCSRDHQAVRFTYPIGTHKVTGKPVDDLRVRVRLEGQEPIKSIYSPTHTIQTHRATDTRATITLQQQDVTGWQDFQLVYALDDQRVGATVLSYRPSGGEDGYFLLLASPGFTKLDQPRQAKTVIFVLDKSGSMAGKKIEQARDAVRFVLNNLHEEDTFNIIAYDDHVQAFAPELQRIDAETRAEALAFVEGIRDGGSTNIDEALRTAMGMVQDDSRPSYVLFLTDGRPTAGEQDELKIAQYSQQANQHGAGVIAFGVGYDVNARLLDRISHGNGGTSEYVKPEENLESAVSRFYAKLTSPILSRIQIAFDDVVVTRAYPREVPDLFEGGQLVWVGRYAASGKSTVRITGWVHGSETHFEYPVVLAGDGGGCAYSFVERLWAVRRVGDLIDQLDLHGQNQELIEELVRLSTRYGILTPYTAFLADQDVQLNDLETNARMTLEASDALNMVSGRSGTAQRAYKQKLNATLMAPAQGAQMAEDVTGNARQVQAVQNVGDKTFFQKEGCWIDASLTPEQEADVIVIKQYSEAYFELSRQLSSQWNQYLSFNEPVTVVLDGKAYRIEQAVGP